MYFCFVIAKKLTKMEDLSKWSVDRLIKLHTLFASPNKDVFKVSIEYENKQAEIKHLIQTKLRLNHYDTSVILNYERLHKEKENEYYYEKAGDRFELKMRQRKGKPGAKYE